MYSLLTLVIKILLNSIGVVRFKKFNKDIEMFCIIFYHKVPSSQIKKKKRGRGSHIKDNRIPNDTDSGTISYVQELKLSCCAV